KAAFPRHAHHRNEEMFVIIRGSGEYRAGDESWPVKEGDVIAAPAGNGEAAHQMRNDSEAELVYLAVSTRHDPDVVEYPDSGKFAVASMVPAEGGIRGARIAFIGKQEDSLDYWDGEDIGEEQE
ncbi:MAG TPA: cupin domain-containing protein, partial [Devosia sp.]|nr:cupin domain-containing protein [Devosia sp.]